MRPRTDLIAEPLVRALHATVYEPLSGPGGPPIVLLHGLLTSADVWADVVPLLPPSRRIVAPDLRGHGRSGPPAGDVGLDELVDDLFAVLDALSVHRAILVGLSLGGLVCLRAALSDPARVAGLALVATPLLPESAESRARRLGTLDAMRRLGNRRVLRGMAAWLFGRTTRRSSPQTVERWLDGLENADPVAIRRTAEAALGRTDVRPWLERLAVPTLFVVGEEDSLVGADHGSIAPDRRAVIAQAGHLVPLEQPEAAGTILGRWIETVPDFNPLLAGDRDAHPVA